MTGRVGYFLDMACSEFVLAHLTSKMSRESSLLSHGVYVPISLTLKHGF